MRPPPAHVLVRTGDASDEVEAACREIGSPEAAGLSRYFYVEQARQTVVMTHGPEAPLARMLRGRPGWLEPGLEEREQDATRGRR